MIVTYSKVVAGCGCGSGLYGTPLALNEEKSGRTSLARRTANSNFYSPTVVINNISQIFPTTTRPTEWALTSDSGCKCGVAAPSGICRKRGGVLRAVKKGRIRTTIVVTGC